MASEQMWEIAHSKISVNMGNTTQRSRPRTMHTRKKDIIQEVDHAQLLTEEVKIVLGEAAVTKGRQLAHMQRHE
jgi:hypothetical protein